IRERDAQLDDVGAAPRRLPHQAPRHRERGIPRREVGDQRPLPPRPERREGGSEPRERPRGRGGARHRGPPCPLEAPPSRAWATVCTSLSPRPESPISTLWVFFMRAAARIACATACEDSSAGMMPSSRVRALKPSSASWSVTETYSKRPRSL